MGARKRQKHLVIIKLIVLCAMVIGNSYKNIDPKVYLRAATILKARAENTPFPGQVKWQRSNLNARRAHHS